MKYEVEITIKFKSEGEELAFGTKRLYVNGDVLAKLIELQLKEVIDGVNKHGKKIPYGDTGDLERDCDN